MSRPHLGCHLLRRLAGERKLSLGFIALVLVSLFLVLSLERVLGSHHSTTNSTTALWVLTAIAGVSGLLLHLSEFLFHFGWYTMVRILLALSKGHRREHQWHVPSRESLYQLWH